MNRIVRAADALGIPRPKNLKIKLAKIATIAVAISGMGLTSGVANAATLSSTKVGLSDPRPSTAAVSYTFTGSSVTSANIKCVKAVFSTTAANEVQPSGWDGTGGTVTAASSTLVNSSATNWSLATSDGTGAGAGADNVWKYTNSASGITPSTLTNATFIMAGITNSNTVDTAYYLKINTYDNTDCSTTPRDNAIVEFINTNGSLLSLTVDNTLTFTVNGRTTGQTCSDGTTAPTVNTTSTTIPFGTVTPATPGIACQRLNAASNSTNGYTIYMRYDQAPTNALSQSITDWSGSNTTPTSPFTTVNAQGAYGYTTSDNTLGTGTTGRFTTGTKFAATTTSNAEVGYESAGVTSTDYIVTHQVAVTTTTFPGTYTNTIIYTCTPVY
jgi:hypothetical protein